MAHKIIDNFLEHQDFLEIKNIFEAENVPWYHSRIVIDTTDDNFQFVHNLYSNHQFLHSGINYLTKIINKIQPVSIFRIKVNLRPRTDIIREDYFHLDRLDLVEDNIPYTIGIFYLNTNNGCTILENGIRIKSVENRMLLMSGDTKHSGTSATDCNKMVINFNFLNKETSSLYSQE